MKLLIDNGLAFVAVTLTYKQQTTTLNRVLLDTGSAGTVFSADSLLSIGLQMEASDELKRIRGVGGAEFVFTKEIDNLSLDKLRADNFSIEVGAVNYGFEIEGILGMDFLLQTKAKIDLENLTIA